MLEFPIKTSLTRFVVCCELEGLQVLKNSRPFSKGVKLSKRVLEFFSLNRCRLRKIFKTKGKQSLHNPNISKVCVTISIRQKEGLVYLYRTVRYWSLNKVIYHSEYYFQKPIILFLTIYFRIYYLQALFFLFD